MHLFKVTKRLCYVRKTVGYVIEDVQTRQLLRVTLAEANKLGQEKQLVNAEYDPSLKKVKGTAVDFRTLPQVAISKNIENYNSNDIEWCLMQAKFCRTVIDWIAYITDTNPNIVKPLKNYALSFSPNTTALIALETCYNMQGGGVCCSDWKLPNPLSISKCDIGKPIFNVDNCQLLIKPQQGTTVARTVQNTIILYPNYFIYHSKATKDKATNQLSTVLIHEIGHLFSEMYPNLQQLIMLNPQDALGRYNVKENRFYGMFGNTSPEESWADCFMMYHVNPVKLKTNPKAYDFVNMVINQIKNYDLILVTYNNLLNKLCENMPEIVSK